MTPEEIQEWLSEIDEDMLFADGFEAALIGTVEGGTRLPVACYDYDLCIQILMERDGMDEEEADEYMSFNVTGAYVGEMTPMFVHDLRNTGNRE